MYFDCKKKKTKVKRKYIKLNYISKCIMVPFSGQAVKKSVYILYQRKQSFIFLSTGPWLLKENAWQQNRYC